MSTLLQYSQKFYTLMLVLNLTEVLTLQAAQSDAEKHARMLSKLGGAIKAAKLRSMPDVVSFVQEAQEQLAVLRADEGLVVSQLDAWPKTRYVT